MARLAAHHIAYSTFKTIALGLSQPLTAIRLAPICLFTAKKTGQKFFNEFKQFFVVPLFCCSVVLVAEQQRPIRTVLAPVARP
jgi:hypothetical protein